MIRMILLSWMLGFATSISAVHAKDPSVFLVMLRQPYPASSHPNEMRTDPFWEFGSFGLTGCHSRNLLHPRNAKMIEGSRLGFVQGGKQGMKLVYLTPPIHVICHPNVCEATWLAAEAPFQYGSAPIVANYEHETDFPLLAEEFAEVRRETPVSQFGSRFRSRTQALPERTASELIRIYESLRKQTGVLALKYTDALPKLPPKVDLNRSQTYLEKLKAAGAVDCAAKLTTVFENE